MNVELSHIWEFVTERNVFTLASSYHNQAYCTPCFYAFHPKTKQLVFKSNSDTRHVEELRKEERVAGSILPEKLAIGHVKGIQFTGTCGQLKDFESTASLSRVFYKDFPFARAMGGDLWVVTLNEVKLTDNKLGFGKKLLWKRSSADSHDFQN